MRRSLTLLLGLMLVLGLLTSALLAQDTAVKPRFVVLPARLSPDGELAPSSSSLELWKSSFTYKGKTYNYNMVGAAPSTNTSATINVYVIPVKIVITNFFKKKTIFDPSTVLSNGNTVTQNTVTSPIFDSTTTYTQGGVDVGTTQYIDAFQRANFWGTVSTNPNSHVLLNVSVLPEQTLSPPGGVDGRVGTVFGFKAGLVDINWFDGQIQSLITSLGITPNIFPIFLTYDVYLTQGGGCCIGGYHSAVGSASNPQTYAHATYVDHPGAFSQDVSALSHEVGEWVDDPTINNNTPCGTLEVGDPLERNANFGGIPYVLHGFTYNLQDLVTLPYFGAPPSTSVNNYFTFQGESLTVCQNGG